MFHICKVVTRNFIMDFVAGVQNIFGLNLTSYEKMVDKAVKQCQEEMKLRKISPLWFRMEISQLTNGAMAVMIYGEEKVVIEGVEQR